MTLLAIAIVFAASVGGWSYMDKNRRRARELEGRVVNALAVVRSHRDVSPTFADVVEVELDPPNRKELK